MIEDQSALTQRYVISEQLPLPSVVFLPLVWSASRKYLDLFKVCTS